MNLYGRFIQIHILTDHLPFSSQAKVFIAGNKQGGVRDFEIQGKVNWIKKTTSAFSPWAVSGLKLCPRRWSSAVSWAARSSHPGAQWLRYHIELLAVLLRHEGGTAFGLLESGWVISSVPGTKAFTCIDY